MTVKLTKSKAKQLNRKPLIGRSIAVKPRTNVDCFTQTGTSIARYGTWRYEKA